MIRSERSEAVKWSINPPKQLFIDERVVFRKKYKCFIDNDDAAAQIFAADLRDKFLKGSKVVIVLN